MSSSPHYRPARHHLELGPALYDPVTPARFPKQVLRFRNQRWATRVGLDGLDDDEWARHFAHFDPLPENLPEPLALRYHGHQFRSYNPHLGDGRGFLFAQLADTVDDRLLDLGTKGSGTTPYSRGGDGRLTLKGGVRELLATEMLEALGVYTSKSFSLFETGELLQRGDEPSPTRSSVLVRLSHSHVRFGTFQRLAALGDVDAMRRLVEHCVRLYLPEAREEADLPVALLRAVCARSAVLAASWLAAGFVHGVLNTDNMNITGESFDYGPWRFLSTFDLDFVAAYFDETGLYAFGRQPSVVLWNCTRLAEALTSLVPVASLQTALGEYEPTFRVALAQRLHARLGVRPTGNTDDDQAFVGALYSFLGERKVACDQFFFDWYAGSASRERALAGAASDAYRGDRFDALLQQIEAREPVEPARLGLPAFRRLRPPTLVVGEVERVWARIAEADDWQPLGDLIAAIRQLGDGLGLAARPFTDTRQPAPAGADLAAPPHPASLRDRA